MTSTRRKKKGFGNRLFEIISAAQKLLMLLLLRNYFMKQVNG
jgi:hypothetical protein